MAFYSVARCARAAFISSPFSFNKLIDDKSLAARRSVRASLSPRRSAREDAQRKGKKKYLYISLSADDHFQSSCRAKDCRRVGKVRRRPGRKKMPVSFGKWSASRFSSLSALIRVIPFCGTRRNNKQLPAFNRPHAVPAYTANHWLPAEITRKLDDGRILPPAPVGHARLAFYCA